MNKLFALFLVAILAITLSAAGCKKSGNSSESTKHEDSDDEKIPAELMKVADDFCKSSRYMDFMKGGREFEIRATWDAAASGGESVEDYIQQVKDGMSGEDFPWKSCETDKPKIIKCEDAFAKIGGKNGEMRLNKMTSAFKDMGLSSDDCASMEVYVKAGESDRENSYKVFLAKGKSDKWVVIGEDRGFKMPETKAQANLKRLQPDFCDSTKLMNMANDTMEFIARAVYDKNTSGGKSVEDFIRELQNSINKGDLVLQSCRAEIPRALKCDEAYRRMAQAEPYVTEDKLKMAARQMGLSDTECAAMQVTARWARDNREKTNNVFFAKGKFDNWIFLGTDEKPEAAAETAPAAPAETAPAPEAAPAPTPPAQY